MGLAASGHHRHCGARFATYHVDLNDVLLLQLPADSVELKGLDHVLTLGPHDASRDNHHAEAFEAEDVAAIMQISGRPWLPTFKPDRSLSCSSSGPYIASARRRPVL
jgi:hypothetical protein